MIFRLWFIIIGGLLIFMALSGSVLKRLPLTTSILAPTIRSSPPTFR